MNNIICNCGHPESEHSPITRGYGTDKNGKTACYDCCLKQDLQYLKENGKLDCYVSSDGKSITTWPGLKIATITCSHVVDFGYCRNQLSFDAIMPDGTRLKGRGPGNGMFCRVRC